MNIIRAAGWIAGAVLLAAVFILIMHLSLNNMEFSRSNTGWNGTSSFFSDLNRHHFTEINNPENLAGHPRNTTLLIIAPHRTPTKEELTAYNEFLESGNTIFLADDFGTGNEILSGIGSRVSIQPGNISSIDRSYNDPYSVVVYRTAQESPFPLPADMVLDRAAPLEGGTPLMLTSVMSWSDANGDRRFNWGEDMGTLPVMVTDPKGSGRIIVLSDPSIFINSMYSGTGNDNNRYVIHNLVSGDSPVLIDQMNSRTADATRFGGILREVRNAVNIEIFILCLLILGIAGAWKMRMI
ncbi:MAG: DUF4350 domain-containing protein [Methanoregula sp.]|nr:DUF4350 domain-containing protein [Methanoregula sp.]